MLRRLLGNLELGLTTLMIVAIIVGVRALLWELGVTGMSPTAVRASSSCITARPKSKSFTRTSGLSASRTFAGLTSRWTIPWACAFARPSRI